MIRFFACLLTSVLATALLLVLSFLSTSGPRIDVRGVHWPLVLFCTASITGMTFMSSAFRGATRGRETVPDRLLLGPSVALGSVVALAAGDLDYFQTLIGIALVLTVGGLCVRQ